MMTPLKLFSRNKTSTDPNDVVSSCLKKLVDRVTDSLDHNEYRWSKPWGVKRFESLILSKFMIEYSFKIISTDKLQDDEKIAFYDICNNQFEKLFNSEFNSVGLNYEDMQEDIQFKLDKYIEARNSCKPPVCWHLVYQLITKCPTRDELKEDVVNKTAGLELIRANKNFSAMVPQYESQIKLLQDKLNSYESAEMMLPHMVRFTKDILRAIKLKKIKSLSKKIAKKDKDKKK